jgi:glycosyltransferase 2 family protein
MSMAGQNQKRQVSWLGLLAVMLLAFATAGVLRMPSTEQQALVTALHSLFLWLPVLYGVVALSYAGRYWRWRLLLGRLHIGRTGWSDLLGWFRGFALTATPAKVGELSRVQLLHEQLGYPRVPLVHVFVAERFSDVAAVAMLLLVLTPTQLLDRLPSLSNIQLFLVPILVLAAVLLANRSGLGHSLRGRWQLWGHHLPSDVLARATLPSIFISVLVWANEALVLWLLVRLLAPVSITIPTAVAIYLLSGTAGMASTLPGGIGVNEAATVLMLGQHGIPAAISLPIAIVRRLITLWSMVVLSIAVGVLPLSTQVENRRDY